MEFLQLKTYQTKISLIWIKRINFCKSMTFLKKLDKEGAVQYIDANKKKQTKSL